MVAVGGAEDHLFLSAKLRSDDNSCEHKDVLAASCSQGHQRVGWAKSAPLSSAKKYGRKHRIEQIKRQEANAPSATFHVHTARSRLIFAAEHR